MLHPTLQNIQKCLGKNTIVINSSFVFYFLPQTFILISGFYVKIN